MKKCLSANLLKFIAAAAMLIDHIAWCFADTYSVPGQIMHIIGRMTAPIMCYFIAEGFHYTKSRGKYLLRLGIFAVISWFPFIFMEYGTFPIYFVNGKIGVIYYQSVIFTLFLGLLALMVIHSERLHNMLKAPILMIIFALSFLGDWLIFAVLWIIVFDAFRGNFGKQAAAFTIISVFMVITLWLMSSEPLTRSLFQCGVLLALIPLYFYNGERGRGGCFGKWFFYVFYPAHMLILGIINILI